MHHQDVVLLGQRNHTFEELQFDTTRGRIRRKAEDHHLRLRRAFLDATLKFLEEIDIRRHAYRADVRPGDDRAIDVDRVRGVRHQYRVATIQRRQHQVRQTFLGADGDDGLTLRVETDVIAALVPVADRLAESRDALGDRVAVRVFAQRRLDQLVGDVLRRGLVRIAHAHVDDVLATTAGSHLQLAGDVEHIRRQALDAGKFLHGASGGSVSRHRAHMGKRYNSHFIALCIVHCNLP